jgi:hypothetical protein
MVGGAEPAERRLEGGCDEVVSVAEAGFVILSVAKDLNRAQILRLAQNDMGWLPLFRNRNKVATVRAR